MSDTKHRISFGDVQGHWHDHDIVGSYGKGSHKSLIGRTKFDNKNVKFLVKENNITVLETDSIWMAIEKYNELP